MKKIVRILTAVVLVIALALGPAGRGNTVMAANVLKDAGVRFNLKKSGTVKFKSYVPGVGYKEFKAVVKSYSLTKETVDLDGDVTETNRIRMKIVIKGPNLSDKELKALKASGENYVTAVDTVAVNLKTGRAPYFIKSPKSSQKSPIVTKRSQGGSGYVNKRVCNVDFNFLADDKVAIGVCGSRKHSTDLDNQTAAFINGKAKFVDTYYYAENNNKLSTWIKLK